MLNPPEIVVEHKKGKISSKTGLSIQSKILKELYALKEINGKKPPIDKANKTIKTSSLKPGSSSDFKKSARSFDPTTLILEKEQPILKEMRPLFIDDEFDEQAISENNELGLSLIRPGTPPPGHRTPTTKSIF